MQEKTNWPFKKAFSITLPYSSKFGCVNTIPKYSRSALNILSKQLTQLKTMSTTEIERTVWYPLYEASGIQWRDVEI